MTRLIQCILFILLSFILSCTGNSSNTGNSNNTSNGETETPVPQPPNGDGNNTNPTLPPGEPKDMIRKNIYSWASNGPEMTAYKKGIAAMKARSANDPTSWAYQAAIHGSNVSPEKAAWNQCQHQSFFFLSWHRMYLYYFERILRVASEDPEFTLPYWNYSDPDERAIPAAFRTPANSSNPLYVQDRNPGVNEGFAVPASATDYEAAFEYDNFFSAEGSPLSFGGQEV